MIWLDAMEANEQGDREVALALNGEVVSLEVGQGGDRYG